MRTVPLGELGDIISGSTPKTGVPEFWNGDIPWVTPADLSEHDGIYFHGKPKKITQAGFKSCSTTMLLPGSILFSSRAPIGHCAVTTFPLCTNQGFKNIVPNKRLDPLYGYFALKFITPSIIAKGRGATFAEVTKDMMEEVQIPYCDLPEQQRIAELLEQADRLRRTRRYALELSDTFLPAAFLELFGDPARNPKGWTEHELGEVVSAEKFAIVDGPFGSELKAEEYTDTGVRVIRVNNIRPNEFNFEDVRYISPTKYETIARSTVRPGDVIMAKVGNTIGKTCVFPEAISFAVLTANVCKITLDRSIVLPVFVAHQMNHDAIQARIVALSGDTAKPMINIPKLRQLKLIIPPLPLQERFASLAVCRRPNHYE